MRDIHFMAGGLETTFDTHRRYTELVDTDVIATVDPTNSTWRGSFLKNTKLWLSFPVGDMVTVSSVMTVNRLPQSLCLGAIS